MADPGWLNKVRAYSIPVAHWYGSDTPDEKPNSISRKEIEKRGVSMFDNDMLELSSDDDQRLFFGSLDEAAKRTYMFSSTSKMAQVFQTWNSETDSPLYYNRNEYRLIGKLEIEDGGGIEAFVRTLMELKTWERSVIVGSFLRPDAQADVLRAIGARKEPRHPYQPPGPPQPKDH